MAKETKKSRWRELEQQLTYRPRPVWSDWDDRRKRAATAYAADYRAFLDRAKTERLCVQQAVKLARAAGFADFAGGGGRGAGKKYFFVQKQRALALLVTGKRPLTDGMNIVAAHIDAPRLDLKVRPLFEDSGVAVLRTHYYGGIKKYQWMNVPLALHGVAVRGDGTTVTLAVGDRAGDPQFTIPDLEPHLAYKRQNEKKLREAVTGEEMLILAGAEPVGDDETRQKLKLGVLRHLHREYGLTEADLIGADLSAVPATKTAEVGFDRLLVGGYGQDDRACAYAALRALLDGTTSAHIALV
ncbi:MAG TPA: aminopeptidase, partial [bacterium]|nr:aminopeptidase [bacterium]